jgi:hypothetical protein
MHGFQCLAARPVNSFDLVANVSVTVLFRELLGELFEERLT